MGRANWLSTNNNEIATPIEIRELRGDLVRIGLIRTLWGYGLRQRVVTDPENVTELIETLGELRTYFDPQETLAVHRIVGLGSFLVGMDDVRDLRDKLRVVGVLDDYKGSTSDKEYIFNDTGAKKLTAELANIMRQQANSPAANTVVG